MEFSQGFNRSVAGTVASIFTALGVGGCSTLGNRTYGLPRQEVTVTKSLTEVPVALNPCTREGLKIRNAWDVTYNELVQRVAEGERFYQYRGQYIFSKPSVAEKIAPAAAGIAVAALGYAVGGGGVAVRVATTVAGGAAGAIAGDIFAQNARIERLAQEAGCEEYIDTIVIPRDAGKYPPPPVYSGNQFDALQGPHRVQPRPREFIVR